VISTPVSPLRQRMIEDMAIRQFGPKTQHDYVRVVADFARFLGRSPDRAEPEDLRRYQLHLAAQGASPGKMNAAVSALRFFCKVTLGRPAFSERLATVRQGERLPVVLSPEEVALLLHCAPGLKHKAALSVAYGRHRGCPHPRRARRALALSRDSRAWDSNRSTPLIVTTSRWMTVDLSHSRTAVHVIEHHSRKRFARSRPQIIDRMRAAQVSLSKPGRKHQAAALYPEFDCARRSTAPSPSCRRRPRGALRSLSTIMPRWC
jgi:hypothetical protein